MQPLICLADPGCDIVEFYVTLRAIRGPPERAAAQERHSKIDRPQERIRVRVNP